MDILHITPELAPVAKVGGLGDAVYGLARASAKKGATIRVLLPKYDVISACFLERVKVEEPSFTIFEEGRAIHNTILSARLHSIEVWLLDTTHPKNYFKRGKIYGEADDNDRFLYFCRAAAEWLSLKNQMPDVLHLHDWTVAALSFSMKNKKSSKTVFTIHSMEHQGRCAPHNLERLGIEFSKEALLDPLYPDCLNLLKGAIHFSDALTTVSPTHAQEIQTKQGGFGLDSLVQRENKKLTGILNGIDTEYWNTQTDPFLAQHYGHENRKEGKAANKAALQKRLHLPQTNSSFPLVCSITRLTAQKSPELIQYGIEHTLKLGGQFVLVGTAQDPEINAHFHRLKKSYSSQPSVAFHLEFNEELSHFLYAAADLFLMPSLFEPCGLTQLIALHYGTLPIVHLTGGLKDTVFDLDSAKKPNGFGFTSLDRHSVASTLERAFHCFFTHPLKWQELTSHAMTQEVSWDKAAEKYATLYSFF